MNEIINNSTNFIRVQFIGDGLLKNYPFWFNIFDKLNIEVYINSQKLSQGYKVELNNDQTGNVIFDTAPQQNSIITIVRNMKIERRSDFQEGGALRAKVLNDELDYQVACLQQLKSENERTMQLPIYEKDIDLKLPTPQAGKAILWNNTADGLINSDTDINTMEASLKNAVDIAVQKAAVCEESADITQSNTNLVTENTELVVNLAQNLKYFNQSIYQAFCNIETSEIILKNDISIYKKNISQNTVLSFNLSELSKTDHVVTFELILDIDNVSTITFPANTIWLDNISPNLSQTGNYLLVFRTLNFGTHWIGNLQGRW